MLETLELKRRSAPDVCSACGWHMLLKASARYDCVNPWCPACIKHKRKNKLGRALTERS